MGEIGEFELMRRRQIVQLANKILNSGAHYLWGAQSNGQVRMCRNAVGETDEQIYLFAASLNGGTQYVCAGRSAHPNVVRLHQRRTLEQANQAAATNGSGYKWTRYYRDGDTVNPSPSALVYGESCGGKLHFDCAGFVRHCYRQVLNIPIRSMRGRTTEVWRRAGNNDTLANIDIYPGDILYGHGHVGLATGKTEYGAVSPNMAIHAYHARVGVVATAISDAPRWAEVRRWNDWTQPS